MKHRNPLGVFFLSIITFGIYDLYWLAQVRKELNNKTRFHVPSVWLLIAPVLLLIIGYVILFASAASTVSSVSSSSYGSFSSTVSPAAHSSGSPLVGLLSLVVIGIGWLATLGISIYWFFNFSKAVGDYTNGKMSTAVTFLILWLVHLIGVALVQDAFNDMIETGATPGSGQALAPAYGGQPPANGYAYQPAQSSPYPPQQPPIPAPNINPLPPQQAPNPQQPLYGPPAPSQPPQKTPAPLLADAPNQVSSLPPTDANTNQQPPQPPSAPV